MAPRVKFTRDEMVQAALSVVKAKGISALTARAIADELGVLDADSTLDITPAVLQEVNRLYALEKKDKDKK